jgi:glutamine amidotransferase
MIVIIDYRMGNVGSIFNMAKKIGVPVTVSFDPATIREAEKLILSGVGSFDAGMKNLAEMGLMEVLNKKVIEQKTPILGICLGMQLFTRKSEEGVLPGLGWIKAETKRFKFEADQTKLKIPHVGWNTVKIVQNNFLFKDIAVEPRFYFTHSYHVVCDDEGCVLAKTCYGYDFTSSILMHNIVGVQFHPEKSHRFGMGLIKNFLEL